MKVAILGGRFDPPHIGHFLIAQQILDYNSQIKKVLMIPANIHQWKKSEASPNQRFEMLKLLNLNAIEISDVEIKRGGVSYSVDTINEIKRQFGYEIFWVVGSDILQELSKWKKSEDLIRNAKFLVFPRDPYTLPSNLPEGFEVIKNPNLVTTNISSTLIKWRIKNKLSITNFVPKQIEEYIYSNNLYI